MTLGEYLKRQGESQQAFADRAGVPQTTVTKIVNGAGSRTFTAIKIVEATGGLVTFSDLAGQEYGARSRTSDTGDSADSEVQPSGS